jgi:hypothetical protein
MWARMLARTIDVDAETALARDQRIEDARPV